MEQGQIKKNTLPWVYFVFNWGSPVGCYPNAFTALALCKILIGKWGNQIPEGALEVYRYRPSREIADIVYEDITEVVLKHAVK